ncbi:MAG: proprotein convertase P-domain-containing protein [Deltaproteobacteria bacterium]|nr:proprotein convertase P-domain-containing protein [Deltaproteobacteria bacterium]
MRKFGFVFFGIISFLALGCGGESGPGDVCDPNPCTAVQDAVCDGDLLLIYSSPGTCTASGIEALCTYPLESTTDCSTTGQVCDPATTSCVQCLRHADCGPNQICENNSCRTEGNPCDPNPCNEAPAAACNDEALETYTSAGTCTDNNGTAACDYPVDSSTDCTETSEHCNEALSACAECGDNSHCTAGIQICEEGICVDGSDVCVPNPCDQIPATECDGNDLVSYRAECLDVDGMPQCSYPEDTRILCGDSDEICDPTSLACIGCMEDEDCGSALLVCVDSLCVDGCIDDLFEDNDSLVNATVLGGDTLEEDLVLCAGDEDFFAFTASEGDLVSVLITFPNDVGDLQLELIGPDGSTVVSSGLSGDDDELIEDLPIDTGNAGSYGIRIFGATATDKNIYDLVLTLSDDPCFPNPCDTPPVDFCIGDELTTYPGQGICDGASGTAECSYPPTINDCVNQNQRCDSASVACVDCLGDIDCVWPFEVCTGNDCVAGCQDDTLEENDTIDAFYTLPDSGSWTDLVYCEADMDFYGIDLVDGEEILVNMTFSHAAGDLVLVLAHPDGAQAAASATSTDDEQVSYVVLPGEGGLFKIIVSGAEGTQNSYDLDVTISDDPCLPNPCTQTPATACVGNILTTYTGNGVCTDNAGSPECNYSPNTETDCSPTGAVCQNDACVGRFAEVGDLLISEIMANPAAVTDDQGEWFELTNLSVDSLNLRDLVFTDAAANTFTVQDDILVLAGDPVVLAINADIGTNGGIVAAYDYPGSLALNNTGGDTLTMTRDGDLVDEVIFPDPISGASYSLDPDHYDVFSNDEFGYWCTSTTAIGSGDFGTPNDLNELCSTSTYTIGWCRVQFPTAIAANPDAQGLVYGMLYVAGLTDLSTGVDMDPALLAEVGYGPTTAAPTESGWTWFPAIPNPNWDGGATNNDEYLGLLTVPSAGTNFHVAYRFSGDRGASWTVCDIDDTTWDIPPTLDVTFAGSYDHFAGDVPVPILDNDSVGTTSIINAAWFEVLSVSVEVNITHPAIEELELELISPSGTVIVLYAGGSTGADLVAFYGVNDTPIGNLADFEGEQSANGWTLRMVDTGGSVNGGTLNSWALHFSAQ